MDERLDRDGYAVHRLDPLHLHHAARALGRLVGEGRASESAALEFIQQWGAEFTGQPINGLSTRLGQRMLGTAQDVRRERDAAVMAIRWAVRPLFMARAEAAAIEEAAGQANGDVLEWPEVAAVLREEMLAARGRRWG